MVSLCGVFDVYNSRDRMEESIKRHGYVEGGDSRDYNRDAVKEQLEELCERKSLETEMILWWEKEGEEETIYLVSPIVLSLLLEEYDVTKRLIEVGYMVQRM